MLPNKWIKNTLICFTNATLESGIEYENIIYALEHNPFLLGYPREKLIKLLNIQIERRLNNK